MSQNRILFFTLLATAVAAGCAALYVRGVKRAALAHQIHAAAKGNEIDDGRAVKLRETKERWERSRTLAIEARMGLLLSVGDSREKIEQVLRENGMMFAFNSLEHRYEAWVDANDRSRSDQGMVMDIYVDGSNRLTRYDLRLPPASSN